MEAEKRPHRSLQRTREFRDGVLRLGEEWQSKEKGQGRGTRSEHGSGFGWKIATVDLWKALVQQAGGEGEELRPFFMYVPRDLVTVSYGP